jgi:glucose 1-dehydrogenase
MRVLITGANRGIGRSIALRLAKDGAAIAAIGRSHPDELETLKGEVASLGGRCVTITCDVGDVAATERAVATAVDGFGGLDCIISNAAYAPTPKTMVKNSVEEWDRAYAVNVRAAWVLARASEAHLKASKGQFIVISSINGTEACSLMGIYGSTKATLNMMVRALAQEWRADGVRANSIAPGMVLTPLSEEIYANPERAERRLRLVPLGRIGTPEDTAETVAWILSPDAAQVTGQTIIIDGGYLGSIQCHTAGKPIWLKEA